MSTLPRTNFYAQEKILVNLFATLAVIFMKFLIDNLTFYLTFQNLTFFFVKIVCTFIISSFQSHLFN